MTNRDAALQIQALAKHMAKADRADISAILFSLSGSLLANDAEGLAEWHVQAMRLTYEGIARLGAKPGDQTLWPRSLDVNE